MGFFSEMNAATLAHSRKHNHILPLSWMITKREPRYWDETADSRLSSLLDSPVFQEDAFGGTGSGSNRYVTDGPFANTTLRLQRLGTAAKEYRISRSLSARNLAGAGQSSLNACFQIRTYTAAWECWHGQTHGAGHSALGGLNMNVVLSPGDPAFYLHVSLFNMRE